MEVSKGAIKFKRLVHFSKGIVFLTAISGITSSLKYVLMIVF
jgi:hypothetical protein